MSTIIVKVASFVDCAYSYSLRLVQLFIVSPIYYSMLTASAKPLESWKYIATSVSEEAGQDQKGTY